MYMYIVRTYVFEYVVLCIATVAAPSLVQIHHAAKAYRSCALIRIVHEQILPMLIQLQSRWKVPSAASLHVCWLIARRTPQHDGTRMCIVELICILPHVA